MVERAPLQQLLDVGLQASCSSASQMLGLSLTLAEHASPQAWQQHLQDRQTVAPMSASVALSGIGTGAMVLGFSDALWHHMQQFFAQVLAQSNLPVEALHSGVGELINIIACTCVKAIGERIDGLIRPDVPQVHVQTLRTIVLQQQKLLQVPAISYGTFVDVSNAQHWLDVYWLLDASAANAVSMRLARYRNGL